MRHLKTSDAPTCCLLAFLMELYFSKGGPSIPPRARIHHDKKTRSCSRAKPFRRRSSKPQQNLPFAKQILDEGCQITGLTTSTRLQTNRHRPRGTQQYNHGAHDDDGGHPVPIFRPETRGKTKAGAVSTTARETNTRPTPPPPPSKTGYLPPVRTSYIP